MGSGSGLQSSSPMRERQCWFIGTTRITRWLDTLAASGCKTLRPSRHQRRRQYSGVVRSLISPPEAAKEIRHEVQTAYSEWRDSLPARVKFGERSRTQTQRTIKEDAMRGQVLEIFQPVKIVTEECCKCGIIYGMTNYF